MPESEGAHLDIIWASMSEGVMLRSDGVPGKITEWFDADGEDVDSADDAVVVMVEWSDGRLSTVEVGRFEMTH
ncbi:hypothetical protein V5F49_20455 [Xanthobacter sp. V3C-3]|uniref:hypothetical protein n=1 Tax=Xanthobacter lutulentifluminis TaxID=3119935 RepID=UPI00372A4475